MIVALTGWGQESDRRQTQAAGFNQHLVKPADITVLEAVPSFRAALEASSDGLCPAG